MIYIGIDPGKKGGYAVMGVMMNGAVKNVVDVYVHPWDDGQFVYDMVAVSSGMQPGEMMACVEKVGAMPGQGVTSMFNFGKNAGYIEGVLTALGIPYQLVTPQRWKKEFTLHNSKQKSVEVCKRLFPDVDLLPSPRCRVASDGMAEALLMAEYARRNL